MKRIFTSLFSSFLSVLFLGYILVVGAAELPQCFENILTSLKTGTLPIAALNEQYEQMLDTDKDVSLLQNRGTYINLSGFMANAMGQPLMNERVKLKNGHLASVSTESIAPAVLEDTARNVIFLSKKQAEIGGQFLFVMCPTQVSKYEDLLPPGYSYPYNDAADQLIALLRNESVACLDLRDSMKDAGMTHDQAFLVTDHHWTSQTGFWAYGEILQKLAGMNAISAVDPFFIDENNFEYVTYEEAFLGSSGRRTGRYFAGVDDVTFLKPAFATNISISVPARSLDLTGRYEDICYNTDVSLDYEDPDYFNTNPYGLWGWGDTPITHWRNESAPEDKKCLLIGESFGNIPFSLMSLYFTSCDELDMRYNTDDFPSYFYDYQPDIVVLEVCVGNTISENTQYPYFIPK